MRAWFSVLYLSGLHSHKANHEPVHAWIATETLHRMYTRNDTCRALYARVCAFGMRNLCPPRGADAKENLLQRMWRNPNKPKSTIDKWSVCGMRQDKKGNDAIACARAGLTAASAAIVGRHSHDRRL